MTRGQRTVVTVASGLAIVVVVVTVDRSFDDRAEGGWFMYAPNSGVQWAPSTSHHLRTAALWLAGIACWTALAWVLDRPRPVRGAEGGPAGDQGAR